MVDTRLVGDRLHRAQTHLDLDSRLEVGNELREDIWTLLLEQRSAVARKFCRSDAADEMIGELTLTYNKARQEQITKELLDIVGGVEGLKV